MILYYFIYTDFILLSLRKMTTLQHLSGVTNTGAKNLSKLG